MKRMTSPSESTTSLTTALRRSSNSPRYLAPAISAPMSSETMRRFLRISGTSPEAMRWARPFGDRGLADAGLADQHRVVLGAAGQNLHDAADLLVASDHRVELAGAGELGEIAAVVGEGLVLVLGVGVGDAVRAAQLLDRGEERCPCDAMDGERTGRGRIRHRRRSPSTDVRPRRTGPGTGARFSAACSSTLRRLRDGLRFGAAVGRRQTVEGIFEFALELAGRYADLGQKRGAMPSSCCISASSRWVGVVSGLPRPAARFERLLERFRGFDGILSLSVHG